MMLSVNFLRLGSRQDQYQDLEHINLLRIDSFCALSFFLAQHVDLAQMTTNLVVSYQHC